MSEKLTLAELGEQYWENVMVLDAQIIQAKKDLKECKTEDDLFNASRRIKVLKDMRKECEQIANKLTHYYEPEYKPYVCHGMTRMYGGGRRARKLIGG